MEIKKAVRPEQLRKITAVANELRCSRLKIYTMIESGDLDYVTVNGSSIVVANQKYDIAVEQATRKEE